MKLILGSDLSFLLKYGYALTGIPKDQMKIGYVNTAAKGLNEEKQLFMQKVKNTIRENGYLFEEIDIEGKSKDELVKFFKDKNIVHVDGGSTTYLLRAMRETGFDGTLKELLEEGKIYIGTSAGSYIMCPTIEVSNWDSTGKIRYDVTDFTALNYVPFVFKVHYKDEQEEKVRENMKSLKYPLRILRDGQGILVENGIDTFFGDDKETVLG